MKIFKSYALSTYINSFQGILKYDFVTKHFQRTSLVTIFFQHIFLVSLLVQHTFLVSTYFLCYRILSTYFSLSSIFFSDSIAICLSNFPGFPHTFLIPLFFQHTLLVSIFDQHMHLFEILWSFDICVKFACLFNIFY